MYEEILAIVAFAIENWGAYDTWCLRHGFDPLEIPTRRMVNSIWVWMTEGMEPERVQELILAIQPDTYTELKKKERRRAKSSPPPVAYQPVDKFRAPEGWKPAGYSEEKAYKASQAFIKSQRSGFREGGE